MALNPQQLIANIQALSSGKSLWLAYSGGVDSHVLLDVLAQADETIRKKCSVVHVDHGLNPHSADWSQHCAAITEGYGFEFHCLQVQVHAQAELGLEAAARQVRYQALADKLPPDAVLITAQHQQDQAETLLLQLLRGAGPKGLSAMALRGELFDMTVIRPLLTIDKADILAYAQQQGLSWIDDPSNSNTQINRNYLRHQVWPLLAQRWPSLAQTLARSAAHSAEAVELMDVLAQQDLVLVGTETEGTIQIDALLKLSPARQRNVLRYQIQQLALPLPSSVVLQRILDEVCMAADDAMPLVHWPGGEVRRFQQRLFLMLPLQSVADDFELTISGREPVNLPNGMVLIWQPVEGKGIPESWLPQLTLRFRQGGERIRLMGQTHHSQLKNLMQQWQIPPWQRTHIPLLFLQQELIAVVGLALADSCNKTQSVQQWLPVLRSRV